MMEVEQPEEYPSEVLQMYEKLDRDKATLDDELAAIQEKLSSIDSLRARLIADYGPPSLSKLKGNQSGLPRPRRGSRVPPRECPLSDEEIMELADPDAILEALAQALPEPKVFPTESARWITGVGVVDRDFRSYRVSLRRIMENNPAVWRKEADGGFTHIPTEERNRSTQEPGEDADAHGNGGPNQGNRPLEAFERGQKIDDSLP